MQLQFFCASVFFTEVWIKRVIIYGSSLILADLLFSLLLQEENMNKQSRMKLNLIDLVITVPNAIFSSTFLFDYANLFARMNNFSPSVGIPSFATLSTETAGTDKTIKLELDPATGNYTTSVTDTNGVLGYYNFAGMSGNGITYSVSGNTLTITATPSAAESLGTATKKGNATSSVGDVSLTADDLNFYVKGGSGTDGYQTMVELVSSSAAPVYKSVYLMLQADANGFIEVEKRSSDTSVTDGNSSYALEGAVFSIYSSQSDAEANCGKLQLRQRRVSDGVNGRSWTYNQLHIHRRLADPDYAPGRDNGELQL